MIYTIEIYRIKNNDLSTDRIARSEIMFGYFMNFEKQKTRIYVVYVVKKGKYEPWNGRGKTVERPSNAVGRP
jgi:hypothetical protein